MSISKKLATFGRQYLLVRGEMFNALNHPNMAPPEPNIQNTSFGTITAALGDTSLNSTARVVQLAVKYYF
jgi:hypothetical protein